MLIEENTMTSEKILEILDKGNSKFRLTVTTTRITIKIQQYSNHEETLRVIEFLKKVSQVPDMLNCLNSFRGKVEFNQEFNYYFITMQNDSNTINYIYHEDEI
jgi:hypothetical protein